MSTKSERVAQANEVIAAIARHGHQFFKCPVSDWAARFDLDAKGRIWFIDSYTRKRIYVAYQGRWNGFTNGGTMRSLIEALRDFIRTGDPIPAGHFGPWPTWIQGDDPNADRWGYGLEAMKAVRREVLATGAVKDPRAVREEVSA